MRKKLRFLLACELKKQRVTRIAGSGTSYTYRFDTTDAVTFDTPPTKGYSSHRATQLAEWTSEYVGSEIYCTFASTIRGGV